MGWLFLLRRQFERICIKPTRLNIESVRFRCEYNVRWLKVHVYRQPGTNKISNGEKSSKKNKMGQFNKWEYIQSSFWALKRYGINWPIGFLILSRGPTIVRELLRQLPHKMSSILRFSACTPAVSRPVTKFASIFGMVNFLLTKMSRWLFSS